MGGANSTTQLHRITVHREEIAGAHGMEAVR